MLTNALGSVRRSLPTIAIASVLVAASATSGATAALVITGNDIKNGTVTTKDIKKNNLTSKVIKNGTLKTDDLSSGAVSSLRGATGPAGAAGAPGVSGYQVVTATTSVPSGAGARLTNGCPAGKRVLGAAAELSGSFDGTGVDINDGGTGATASTWNYEATAGTLSLDLICANVT
ncbi:hypothetical protein IEZ26_02900 [Nocardioides cavernae]|uniref:Collagen-like protein n=1 Tax=Nocardioides cavernae TaxID=1921566 RepID=A0ABR8NAR5_9ACTN|nr:hypothetical protein [Nocardioides cavernae]MBD3923554.1 hypothetical protein [Nocardioides cavernae]MBM7511517.1 hypothetical protein [Nocardioides cavernae]